MTDPVAYPETAAAVLDQGAICYLAAPTGDAPHLTPVVFVSDSGRVWLTTARGARKVRLWRRTPAAAGMIRSGGRAVTFRGRVTLYDALDPRTWPISLLRSPAVGSASVRFTLKNLRFFAGYARDAYRVPLAWTPPGRILVSVEPEAGSVLDLERGTTQDAWGRVGARARGRPRFRRRPDGPLPDEEAPGDVRGILEKTKRGSLAVPGRHGPAVLPVGWARAPDEGAYYAVLPRTFLAVAGAQDAFPASLVIDHSSAWRAAKMAGLQLRGEAEAFLPADLERGAASLMDRLRGAGELPEDPAVVRLRPRRAVWWKGWSSGTVGRP